MTTDQQIEKAVLGAMLVNNSVIPDVVTRVRDLDFSNPRHQQVFALIVKNFHEGAEVDALTIADAFMRMGQDPSFIIDLPAAAPTVHNASRHAELVAEHAARRRLGDLATRIHQLAEAGESPHAIISESQTALDEVMATRASEIVKLGAVTDSVMDEVTRMQAGEATSGVKTGFADIDHITNGLSGGQMVIIAARPGVGKSTLAVDFMRHASIKNCIPTLIFSLEMGKEELGMRIISAEAEVFTGSLKRGTLSADDIRKVEQADEAFQKAPLFISDSAEMTMIDIQAQSKLMVAKHGIKMIVVDYLQLLTSGTRTESRQQEVSEFSRKLKLMAKTLDVPVVAISQLNRGVEHRGEDALPKASDLRESGSLEQDADIIMLIHRPGLQNPDHEHADRAEVIIAKHRGGDTGTVALSSRLFFSKFVDYEGGLSFAP
ncbi:replicative DNA helicase [Corynebacterium auriscanis]|uniref:replicative DNA helicase n=1 Tax=Corynebacterium auriscanis TaxID=99807 RepID=UPI003CEE89B7